MGHGFQPAVEDLARRRMSHALFVLDALGITGDAAKDPHVWLDAALMARVYALVGDRLGRRDVAVAAQLDALDRDFSRGLAHCARRTIVTAHAAFGWLARRYGLIQESIAGLDPQQEPGADRIAQLADLARREHVTTIFTETLVSSRVADALAREAGGLRTAVLDPIESADAKLGSYLDRMRRNLGALESALGCT
jgi:zinc transport system substrate-binding protein